MKKILQITIIVAIVFTLCVADIGASSLEISKDEASDLVQDVITCFEHIHYEDYSTWVNITIKSFDPFVFESYKHVKGVPVDFGLTNKTQSFYESSDGVSYSREMIYGEIDPERTDVYWGRKVTCIDDIHSFFREIMTEEVISSAFSYHYTDKTELFRVGENGNVYYKGGYSIRIPTKFFLGCNDFIYNSSTQATISVYLGSHSLTAGPDGNALDVLNVYPVTAEFTKTTNGWRVSGGTFIDAMMVKSTLTPISFILSREGNPISNPSTGDASSYTIPALTVAAIISVALPVTLLRKRRRVV